MSILESIKRDEGLRLKPYTDIVGKLSIGYGRNLTDRGITQLEAEDLLRNDIDAAVSDLHIHMPWSDSLPVAQHDVLVQMAFNLGIVGVTKFIRMIEALQKRDYAEAARQMLLSQWAQQVGARAERLAAQMRTGHA